MAPLLYDTFTGANGTDLTVHTMDVGPGWVWDDSGITPGNGYKIQGNKAEYTTALDEYRPIHSDSGSADFDLTLQATGCWDDASNLSIPVPIFRLADAGNFWQVVIEPTQIRLAHIRTVSGQTFVDSEPFTPVTGQAYTLRVTGVGEQLRAYVDGELLLSYDAANFFSNETDHGFAILKKGSPSSHAAVDWIRARARN